MTLNCECNDTNSIENGSFLIKDVDCKNIICYSARTQTSHFSSTAVVIDWLHIAINHIHQIHIRDSICDSDQSQTDTITISHKLEVINNTKSSIVSTRELSSHCIILSLCLGCDDSINYEQHKCKF